MRIPRKTLPLTLADTRSAPMASARQPIPLPAIATDSTYDPFVVDWRRLAIDPKSDAVVGSGSQKP
jgi:hypothetical protein